MRISAPVKAAAQRLALPFLVLISAVMVLFGKTDLVLYDGLRASVADRVAPLLQAVGQPVAAVTNAVQSVSNAVSVSRENAQLREENARLLQWQEIARRLETENTELRALTKFEPQNTVHSLSAQVIADSGGAFARNVLINSGSQEGVTRGQAALSGEGLVGRISEVGSRTARVLLLTDLNSHIPVELEDNHQHAVLDGDNSEQPRLVYLPTTVEAMVGERIVTVGAGGAPPGLAGRRRPRWPMASSASSLMPSRRGAMPIAIQRDIGYPGRLVPFLTTVLFAFLSIVPLNLPGFAVVMPAFALMAVFHWTVYRSDLLPLSAVFACGLLLDLLNGTPYVGISALVLLIARAAVMAQRKYFVNRNFTIVWLGFLVLAIGVLALLSWTLVCAVRGALIDLRPFIFQAVLTIACYPAASYVLARLQRAFLVRA